MNHDFTVPVLVAEDIVKQKDMFIGKHIRTPAVPSDRYLDSISKYISEYEETLEKRSTKEYSTYIYITRGYVKKVHKKLITKKKRKKEQTNFLV